MFWCLYKLTVAKEDFLGYLDEWEQSQHEGFTAAVVKGTIESLRTGKSSHL